ncbi:hypothetical protein [Nocardioides sambongensis]|uniref:hypothetical protein n=1 Tax=Nocardioides sambongensis TaxID=2589074 RepID=UPI00112B95F6|nr:hypothetical protein [Nocardioides sambongensis]
MARLVAVLCSALLLIAGFDAPVAGASASAKPQIGDTRVERAPIGKKGGLMNPVVWCPSGQEPRIRTEVTGLDTDFHVVWRYRGTLPGMFFPRVAVGRYELATKARCGRRTATRVETVRVKEKTHATTVTRSEFKRIKRGMTRSQVTRIIGYDGWGTSYAGTMWRTYEMMAFWGLSTVEFRDRRVVRKFWKVGHD